MNTIQKSICIFGAGGHGKVVADIFETNGSKVLGFFDDEVALTGSKVSEWVVLGDLENFIRSIKLGSDYFVAIGDNNIRKKITQKVILKTNKLPINCISPSATISKHVKIGKGILVAHHVVVNIDTKIEDGVILNTRSSVDHDCVLSSFSSVQPGSILGGNVFIGINSMVGIGATIKQGIRIGHNVVIGGGAMVIDDIEDSLFVVGVPAKVKARSL